MDSGSHDDAGGESWWSGQPHQHHQQQADGTAAARLPAPLGPTSHPDQQRRPNNKRGAAAASFAASNDNNGEDDDDMMEGMESPEVRSFKRLKLEGGGYNHAGSGASSFSHDAAASQYGQGHYGHAGSETVTMSNHHSHAQQHQMVRLNSYKNSTGGFMRELIYVD